VRRVLTLLLACAGLALAGCSSPPDPEITFHAVGKTVVLSPTQYCDIGVENCTAHADAAGTLRVPRGKPLQISVDSAVAKSAWAVVFTYRNAGGERQPDSRSKLFSPNEQFAYTLKLPEPGDQLESVEIQQYGRRIEIDDQGQIQFFARGTWVLSVDDRA
jgi:hypothetical protein